jgi:galactokinase
VSSHSPSLAESLTTARAHFSSLYGGEASVAVHAPGRVNLIGEHTDYNQGFVLPMAISVGLTLVARLSAEPRIRCFSEGAPPVEISLTAPIVPSEPSWGNYIRGVLVGWQERGLEVPGFDAVLHTTVPLGGGLSSFWRR